MYLKRPQVPVAGMVGDAVRTGQSVNVLDAQSDNRLAEEVPDRRSDRSRVLGDRGLPIGSAELYISPLSRDCEGSAKIRFRR